MMYSGSDGSSNHRQSRQPRFRLRNRRLEWERSQRNIAEADAAQSDMAEVGSNLPQGGGAVPATLYKLSGTEPIPVVLGLDASIGQLVARLKEVMPPWEFSWLGSARV